MIKQYQLVRQRSTRSYLRATLDEVFIVKLSLNLSSVKSQGVCRLESQGKSYQNHQKSGKSGKVGEFEKNDMHGQGKFENILEISELMASNYCYLDIFFSNSSSFCTFSGQVSDNKMYCFIHSIGTLFHHYFIDRYQTMKCIIYLKDLRCRYFTFDKTKVLSSLFVDWFHHPLDR